MQVGKRVYSTPSGGTGMSKLRRPTSLGMAQWSRPTICPELPYRMCE